MIIQNPSCIDECATAALSTLEILIDIEILTGIDIPWKPTRQIDISVHTNRHETNSFSSHFYCMANVKI